MKRFNFHWLSLAVLLLVFMSSCDKEIVDQDTSNLQNSIESRTLIPVTPYVGIADGRFVFPDIETFEEFMIYLESIDIDSLLQTIPSYAYQPLSVVSNVMFNGEELDEEELETVLNEYSTVEIGDKIIKLNFEDEEVYELPSDATPVEITNLQNAESVPDLPANATMVTMADYDLGDSTVDEDEDPDLEPQFICREGTADPAENQPPIWDYVDEPGCAEANPLIEACYAGVRVRYANFGLWKVLKTTREMPCYWRLPGERRDVPNFADEEMSYEGRWEVRCKSSKDGVQELTTTDKDKAVLYRGTRRLASYSISATITFTNLCNTATQSITASLP